MNCPSVKCVRKSFFILNWILRRRWWRGWWHYTCQYLGIFVCLSSSEPGVVTSVLYPVSRWSEVTHHITDRDTDPGNISINRERHRPEPERAGAYSTQRRDTPVVSKRTFQFSKGHAELLIFKLKGVLNNLLGEIKSFFLHANTFIKVCRAHKNPDI